MYICVCKGITDNQIREAAKYANTAAEVSKRLGLGTDCGICVQEAIEVIFEEMKGAAKSLKSDS